MAENSKKTLVLGASENPSRYAYMAANRLVAHGHGIINIGKKQGQVAGETIFTEKTHFNAIHTVTVYLNPTHQKEYYDYILSLNPKRIIFNPGTENEELSEIAQQRGIQTIEACTLVMLSIGEF